MKPANQRQTGCLWLMPVPLSESTLWADCVPATTLAHLPTINHFIAERAKTARAFLKQLPLIKPLAQLQIAEFNEHSSHIGVDVLLKPALEGNDIVFMSEAGCPAVADPGEQVVAAAHRLKIDVRPCIGPSALLLTLMGSGMHGQRFAFEGYLPAEKAQRDKTLKDLELRSAQLKQTQLWIETPYRAQALFDAALAVLRPTTRLCLGIDLTTTHQQILSMNIAQWRQLDQQQPLDLNRRLVVFALLLT
jgi:16S rRNA (cytidine1402-2'-O)-methyltransferase